MRLYHILVMTFITFSSCVQGQWTNKSRILPDELRKVPVAIFITHTPNPNYPELTTPNDNTEYKYVWKHATSVTSVNKDLKVVKAGSYIWYNEDGWKPNVNYNKKDFKNRFDCPKGILKKGETYTFEKNYRWGNNTYGGDALWYILAEDDEGTLYKGIGLIETESEIKNH